MKSKGYQITKAVAWLLVIASLFLVAVVVTRYGGKKVKDANASMFTTTTDTVCYIVYTDEQSKTYAEPYTRPEPKVKLTESELEEAARIVAGQAGGKCLTAQTLVANVLYNQIIANGFDIEKTEYAQYSRNKPTDRTFEAVDAIFERGEWMLDDDVLWTGDAEQPDEWHKSLVYVTECDGIAFYKAYRPAIVPGGAAG